MPPDPWSKELCMSNTEALRGLNHHQSSHSAYTPVVRVTWPLVIWRCSCSSKNNLMSPDMAGTMICGHNIGREMMIQDSVNDPSKECFSGVPGDIALCSFNQIRLLLQIILGVIGVENEIYAPKKMLPQVCTKGGVILGKCNEFININVNVCKELVEIGRSQVGAKGAQLVFMASGLQALCGIISWQQRRVGN
eukprot:9583427-Ditylum_brightwellii.AAC.1